MITGPGSGEGRRWRIGTWATRTTGDRAALAVSGGQAAQAAAPAARSTAVLSGLRGRRGQNGVKRGWTRCAQLWIIAPLALAACGSAGSVGGPVTPTVAEVTPHPCGSSPAPARGPVGATQALRVVTVHVLTGVALTAGVIDVGAASCVDVGVSQRVTVHVRARVPPLPSESRSASTPLLSAIAVSPAVTTTTPQAGDYTLTFTALASGTASITYLPATCALPPGVC